MTSDDFGYKDRGKIK